jgi:twitching motility protein PilT
MPFDLDHALRYLIASEGSDLHLKVPSPPLVRLHGKLEPIPGTEPLSPHDTIGAVQEMLHDPNKLAEFEAENEVDFSYSMEGLARFRVNAFYQRGTVSVVMRAIPVNIKSVQELNLPSVISRLAEEERGIIPLTGTTGSGKSTTLAAMIDHMNRTMHKHIVTIEDPIEFLHEDRGSIVNQREIGLDTESFRRGLRQVLRQDPDVILIGELRDAESAEVALQASESGHLVFTTLHTIDAAETIGRIIEFFPAMKHNQIRAILAGTLRGVVSQRLLPRADGGRVPAVEVMVNNARIADFIRESRTDEIAGAIEDGAYWDMQAAQDALVRLVVDGVVEREIAANAAVNRHDFLIALEHALKQQRADDKNKDGEQLPSISLDGLRTSPRVGTT